MDWPEQPRNVALKDLPDQLREDCRPRREGAPRYLYALLDMGRIQGGQRTEVVNKLRLSALGTPLLDDPEFQELKEHGALLMTGVGATCGRPQCTDSPTTGGNGTTGDHRSPLLHALGASNGDTVSAWVVSELGTQALARHFAQAAFAFGLDGTRFLLRYYDPLILPVLSRLADKAWREWFFAPVVSWWYPVATPREEAWACIEGGSPGAPPQAAPLVLDEALWDALASDPLPYRLLNTVEQMFPSFAGAACYGVRLAKVEELLQAGKQDGLTSPEALTAYVLARLGEAK